MVQSLQSPAATSPHYPTPMLETHLSLSYGAEFSLLLHEPWLSLQLCRVLPVCLTLPSVLFLWYNAEMNCGFWLSCSDFILLFEIKKTISSNKKRKRISTQTDLASQKMELKQNLECKKLWKLTEGSNVDTLFIAQTFKIECFHSFITMALANKYFWVFILQSCFPALGIVDLILCTCQLRFTGGHWCSYSTSSLHLSAFSLLPNTPGFFSSICERKDTF